MPSLTGALRPFAPFPHPVPLPVSNPLVDATITVCINTEWLPYVVGALRCLTMDSTWDSDDENAVRAVEDNAMSLIEAFSLQEPCPVPIQFRPNPTHPQNWDYSLDGGTTWLAGPEVASHYTPVFTADGTSPSGYAESVNGGLSSAQIPLLTATDPNAVITDPTTLLRNEITAGSGVDGLVIQALATIGVKLQSNGVAAAFQKIPGLGLAADAVTQIAQGDGYLYPLLAIVAAI